VEGVADMEDYGNDDATVIREAVKHYYNLKDE